MPHPHTLQFLCQNCNEPVLFSVLDPKVSLSRVRCTSCEQVYAFEDEVLKRHLKKFEALCQQIHDSEEILGNASIAIDVGQHHVKVPFNILLTRLSSEIRLKMNGKTMLISFRVEPLKDTPIPTLSS